MTDLRTILKDAGYVAVGAAVIAFQQAQVRRRDLERQLAEAGQQIDKLTEALEDARKLVEERAVALSGQLESAVADVKARIPSQAFEAIDTAVGAAKDATGQLLDLVRPNTTAA